MIKRVFLFASAKETLGQDSVDLELAADATVADLRKQLVNDYPVLNDLVARSHIAVDQQFALDDMSLTDAREVALIPPVSGG